MSNLSLIVAHDANRGIGIRNTLPWRLPEDLAHFKKITTGNVIIMGRKTFDSIGRPLPNRRNIVLTANAKWQHTGAETAHSLERALSMLDGTPAYIIGGATIYEQALPLCQQLLITEIVATFECDAFFPAIDKSIWQETSRQNYHSDAQILDYAFVTYSKNR